MTRGAPGKSEGRRPSIPEKVRTAVWAAAAGRCTLCNRWLLEDEDLGETVPIGELAHNVGWSERSPRGESALMEGERSHADNLILLCRTCHKSIDDSDVAARYSIERLGEIKREHERRIHFLTGIGASHAAVIIRVVGSIRGSHAELTYDTVLAATAAVGLFPQLLPNAHHREFEVDLRSVPYEGSPDYFATCAASIDAMVTRVSDGVRLNEVIRLAVFAFARIPLLVHLGACLDDKTAAVIFQRHREDVLNAWRWPDQPGVAPRFRFREMRAGAGDRVALVLNVSGTIGLDELPEDSSASCTTYLLEPEPPASPGPSLISSQEALSSFQEVFRAFLAQVEADHSGSQEIQVFAALPVSAAVAMGRALMPNVSPTLELFDRDAHGNFFSALKVGR